MRRGRRHGGKRRGLQGDRCRDRAVPAGLSSQLVRLAAVEVNYLRGGLLFETCSAPGFDAWQVLRSSRFRSSWCWGQARCLAYRWTMRVPTTMWSPVVRWLECPCPTPEQGTTAATTAIRRAAMSHAKRAWPARQQRFHRLPFSSLRRIAFLLTRSQCPPRSSPR